MNPETILVVDDEPQISRVLSVILRHAGYAVTEAPGVAQAREAFALAQTPFNLVVCDVLLSNESGVSVAEDVNRLYPSSRVLLVSGYPIDVLEDRRLLPAELFDGGRVFYKQKPFSNQELLAEVNRILNTKAKGAHAAY